MEKLTFTQYDCNHDMILTIYPRLFFPCSQKKAKLLFTLMATGCPKEEDVEELHTYLRMAILKSTAATVKKRLVKNLELFEKILDLEAERMV